MVKMNHLIEAARQAEINRILAGIYFGENPLDPEIGPAVRYYWELWVRPFHYDSMEFVPFDDLLDVG